MTPSQRYAQKIAKRYGVAITAEILSNVIGAKTLGDVAAEVLPPQKLNQWYEGEMKENNELRAKLGLPPFTEAEQPRPVSRR